MLPVRIWVPACSTGEKRPIRFAMVMAEQVKAAGKNLEIQIFATDLVAKTSSIRRAPGSIPPASPPMSARTG